MISAQDNPASHPAPTLARLGGLWAGRFQAMASPCEVLVESAADERLASELVALAAKEAWRIEHKFSRYVSGNVVDRINRSDGRDVRVDEETARLLDYADQCYRLSDGLFDITSGVLRKVWRFDGSNRVPSRAAVDQLLPGIGWQRLRWQAPVLNLPKGMELDLGGIGKEYAVDRTLMLLDQQLKAKDIVRCGLLVNFGGDLCCTRRWHPDEPWKVGIENHRNSAASAGMLPLRAGALATSGDTHRFLVRNGKRYSHVLNPRTGWPVEQAPHTVTVLAPTCTLAGMLATFAMLQGPRAESFLGEQDGIRYWIRR
ncbi:MAG: FAD:protein FMN transferase [Marinobacter sp.]|jgi:thiamine biosynthesis lipoprotein|nr:FAD:protein FMN transferase [Marinobacter sp.]